jgi:hypothetical protein
MKSSRPPSVWRSLAVALGDGVAFGVGVNLARSAGRPPAADLSRLSRRLERIELRMAAAECAPAQAALPPPAASAAFGREVLDAVLDALDARLRQQAEEVEARLAEMEASLAIDLKTLERQDQSTVAAVEARLAEMEASLAIDLKTLERQDQSTVAAVEARLAEMEASLAIDLKAIEQQDQSTADVEARLGELETSLAIDLKSIEREDQSTAADVEGRLQEVQGQCDQQVTALRDAMAREVEALRGQLADLRRDSAASQGAAEDGRIAAAAAALEARLRGEILDAAPRLGEQLAPVVAALAEKDREIAELRQRLVDNEETVLELVLALGRMRRHAEAPPHEGPPPDDRGTSASAPPEPPAASEPPPPPPSLADVEGQPPSEPPPIAPA